MYIAKHLAGQAGIPARRLCPLLALTMLLAACALADRSYAQGQNPLNAGPNFTQTGWFNTENVPDDVYSMAQTPDGWIWLSSKRDLYRFDGVTAERYNVPLSDHTSLNIISATEFGDLWLGYISGLSILLPSGDFSHPRVVKGIDSAVLQYMQGKHGEMWVRSQHGLFKLSADAQSWTPIGSRDGLAGSLNAAEIDDEGTIWVFTDQGLFVRKVGQSRFQAQAIVDASAWDQVRDAMGNAPTTLRQFIGRAYLDVILHSHGKRAAPTYHGSHYEVTFDSSGRTWFASPQGEYSAQDPGNDELISLIVGIASGRMPDEAMWKKVPVDRPFTLMEDRQHNIWISTISGLAKLHLDLVTKISLPKNIYNYAMLPGNDGTIWFGNAISQKAFGWWHIDRGVIPAPGYQQDTTTAYRDVDQSVLLGTGGGYAYRFDGIKFTLISPLPPGSANGDDILQIARDGRGHLWMSVRGRPLYQWRDGRWVANGGYSQLPPYGALRLVPDATGRLWVSYPKQLFVLDNNKASAYTQKEGMDITNVRDIIPDGMPVVGGDDGLAIFDGQRFHRISAIDPAALSDINGMVRLRDGTLWLNAHKGGVRIRPEELQKSIADSGYRISLRVLGMDEGMPGVAQPTRPVPSLIEGTDGRLWFADTLGIAWLDPTKVPHQSVDPKVVIRSITAGDKTFHPESTVALAAGTHQLQIDYTALGLTNASAARFRYQLEGMDGGWQNVGSRRQAFYTNLGPGVFRFHVEASNEDEAWGRHEASLAISIEPYFYQTGWFLVLAAVVVLALLGLAYLYHLSRLTRRLHLRLEERHAERHRIARELHDTYVQTVHGLVLRVEAASRKLPEGDARDGIVAAVGRAYEALSEGRDRVHALRSQAISRESLPDAFARVAEAFEGANTPLCSVTSNGRPRHVNPLVKDELYASGREAMINAFNHASAKAISVTVSYTREGLGVEVSDDGKGIDPQLVSDGGGSGRWGLRGIRERMERIGGKLKIISDNEAGTTIFLFVDASRAYKSRADFFN